MNKTRILLFLAVLLTSLLAFAQDDESTQGTLVERLGARCPCPQGDQWVVNSVKAISDTVEVELITPSSLAGFLPMLTGENPKAKKLWLQLLSNYGGEWEQLVEYMAKECLPMRLLLKPRGSDDAFCVFFASNEVGTILANN